MLAGGRDHSVVHTLDLKSALALAIALEHAQTGLLMLHDPLSGQLYPALADGMTPRQGAEFGIHRPGLGPFGTAFAEQRPVMVECSGDIDPELRRSIRNVRCEVLTIVPLTIDPSTTLGLLVLLHTESRPPMINPLLLLYAGVFATALDNVHRREIAERASEQAEARSQAKTQFFARISHELRTPLQSVIGYVDLMRLDEAHPLSKHHLDVLARIEWNTEAMLSVIDDLINFSRVEVGRVRYDMRRVPVSDVLSAAEIVLAPMAANKGVTLTTDSAPNTFVHADAGKLKQVLINLAANAVRFTPAGGSVRMSVQKPPGRASRWVTITVSDTGAGIPANKMSRIFEPFVNLGIPTLDGLGGSGLGLPISREFAAAMGGELEASSDGHGSTFTLRMPRDRQRRAPRSAATPATRQRRLPRPRSRPAALLPATGMRSATPGS